MSPLTVVFALLVLFTNHGPVSKAFEVEDMDTCLAHVSTVDESIGKTEIVKDVQGNDVSVTILDAQLKCVAVTQKEHA